MPPRNDVSGEGAFRKRDSRGSLAEFRNPNWPPLAQSILDRASPYLLHRASLIHHRECTGLRLGVTVAGVSFGREVRRRRKSLGLTLEQLAENAGLSSHFLSTVETEKRDPSLTTILKVAKGLGVAPGELLGQIKGVSAAGVEIARQYDAAPSEIQEGVSLILRASSRRRR